MAQVCIFLGSASDESRVAPCIDVLRSLGISFFVTVTSAHRTPGRTDTLIQDALANGCEVFICAAGMAAHLAGYVAGKTIKPVIGIPISGAVLSGMDSLFSTVMMPSGFPVACVAHDSSGSRNAAWLAAQILALHDTDLAEKIRSKRLAMQKDVEEKAALIQQKYTI